MLSSLQGQKEIARINLKLRELAGMETQQMAIKRMQRREFSPPAKLPAIYSVELAELFGNNNASASIERVWYLRLIRQEQRKSNETLGPFMEGAKQIISEYTVTVKGLITSSDLKTFFSTTALKKDAHYLGKGFGSLLIHVLVYCCACADLQMNIEAMHPATISVYSKYKIFACKIHEYITQIGGSLEDSDNIEDGIFSWKKMEHLNIILNPSFHKLPKEDIDISRSEFNPMTTSKKFDLKKTAQNLITLSLEKFAKKKYTTLSAKIYLVEPTIEMRRA